MTTIVSRRYPGLWVLIGLMITAANPLDAQTLLTGVIEDARAQVIEMPRLPGTWQVQIDWMAPEGELVQQGEPVVRVDPGNLISEEEQARTDLEKKRLEGERRLDELALEVLDAENTLALATSTVRLARIDAGIPANTIPRLDYENYQLALQVALQDEERAVAELTAKKLQLAGVKEEIRLDIAKADSRWQRLRDSLDRTTITAEKSGFLIYGENPISGRKVFPGDTLFSGFDIASVASQDGLQFRFWVHEADIHRVPLGTVINITADAVPEISVSATVSWISSQAISREDWSAGGYFEVEATPTVALPPRLMPGMAVLGVPSP